MLIQLIKKIQKSLRVLAKALGSDRLTRFLITSLLTLIFTINFSGISLWLPTQVRSEGSFQFGVSPTTTSNRQGLFEYDSPYSDAGGTTTGIGALRRPIYVDIQSANEIINVSACGNAFADDWSVDIFYVGPQPPSDSNSYNGTYAAYPPPSGTQIFTGGTNANSSIGTAGTNANCENNAVLTTGVGNTTYPVSVLATSGAGVYEIRLRNLTQNANAAIPLTIFRQFDVSITNPTSPTLKIPAAPNPQIAQGRVWSYVWTFNAGTTATDGFQLNRSTNQNYYVVVPGGPPGTNFVWQLDLNQFAGFVYELVANNRGVDSPNAALQNVRGLSVPVAGNSVSPQYRMYTSYPDQTFTRPATGVQIPPTISNLNFVDNQGEDNTFTPGLTGGIQDTGTFSFTSSLPGTYEIIIDTNQDGVYGDAAGLDVQLRGDTDFAGNVSAVWNGRNNAGALLPVGTYNAQVKAIVGEYHFIAGDVETSGPGSGLTIDEATSSSTTSQVQVYWDDRTFLTTGYQAGTGTSTLPNGTLGGRHTWGTTSSGGSQGANTTSWGDVRYLDTFVYGSFSVGTIPAIIGDADNNDFGDAPDTYGTNKANTGGEGIGASQIFTTTGLTSTIKLGTALVDEELPGKDGQPNVAANGDDAANSDDEDGVASFPALATSDATYTVPIRVQNASGANAYLGGWIDFNGNGQFEAAEGVVQTIPTATNGNVNVTWSSLPGIVAGDTYARFRINNDPLTTSDFIGGKRNGEVEDYGLTITSGATTYDWGDAPDGSVGVAAGNYNTTSADNGAAHIRNASLRLGINAPDLDNGLLQNVAADADDTSNTGVADDEDGVTLPNTLTTASTSYTATVNVTNTIGTPATLIGWIDFNKNGLFEATEAQTTSNVPTPPFTVNDNTTNTNYTLTWSGLSGLTQGQTYARFRISNGVLTPSTPNAIIGRGEVEDYVVNINPIDLGDAPDTAAGVATGNYETLIANGGASHTIINTLRIGATTDTDSGLLQNAAADADDTTNTGFVDDEDGVTLGALTTASTTYTATVNVTNTTGSNATLVGWVDFNKNGVFENTAAESQSFSVPNNASPQAIVLNWAGFAAPTAGNTYARFRLSDGALTTSTPNGAVGNGEVEDYTIPITVPTDYGDAPDSGAGTGVNNYETLSTSSGASHTILATLRLGTNAPDSDSGSLQNAAADADDSNGTDDEDGITTVPPTSANLPALTTTSTSYSVTVNVLNNTGAARPLVGWIDFNKNGVFDASEGQSASVPANAAVQPVVLNWAGISGLTAGDTYARFRVSDGALTTATPNGLVGNGEVEDYVVPINTPSVPSLNVVKRITAINGTNITGFADGADVLPSNDNDARWPSPNTQYLRGAIACTTGTPCNGISGGRPGDTVEYTIYFLSNGTDNLRNVTICDRIPSNSTFEPNTYAASTGIFLGWDGTAAALPDPDNSTVGVGKVALTNVADGDKGRFIANPTLLPNAPCSGTANPNGGVVVDVVSAATTVPIATASGVPIPSYGFVRFNVRVN